MEDALYIRRCFDLARLGMGKVAPNPMVGCVIVNGNKIIGEGYHQEYGGYHAEVNAINSVIDKDLLKTAVLYVNLEPCAHYGKTPPCTDLIISSQIPKVVISNVDPFEKVAGKGINKLRAAGISVIVGVLKQDGKELNKRFFTFCEQKRPYIILKWAQSLDGFIDKERNSNEKLKGPTWITGDFFKKVVHKWRAEEQAIMVGTNTAINDNPKLTVREVPGKNPLRIVIDRVLKLPHNLNLFDSSTPTLVLTEQKNIQSYHNIEYQTLTFNNTFVEQVLNILYKRNILSLLVEGGSSLLNSFILKGLWDEARIIIGNKIFGSGIKAPVINGIIMQNIRVDDDTLVILNNNKLRDILND